jgi:N-acetylneuraminic acid mutarotase
MVQSSSHASCFIRTIVYRGFLIGLFIAIFGADIVQAQSWQYIVPMNHARSRPRAAILPNGKIIVVGGNNGYVALTSCEIYDPLTNTWSEGGSMNTPRWNFQLLTLYDGKLLAAGGQTDVRNATTSTCEIYDPATDRWTYTASMQDPREAFQAVFLPANKIALIGGLNGGVGYLTSCDLYDEKTETMSPFPSLQIRTGASAAFYISKDSTIVMPGGYFSGYSGYQMFSTQIYSFKLGSWQLGDSLLESQGNHYNMAQQASTEKIFIVAGNVIPEATQVTGDIESYDLSTGQWNVTGSVTPAFLNRVLFTSDDSILDIGGQNEFKTPISDCWWYNCNSHTASRAPSLPTGREEGAPLLQTSQNGGNPCSGQRAVYLFGGLDSTGVH